MSDNTARQGLPEIAQMQEMDSAQINDALLQLDALGCMHIKGLFVNDPPGSPADGDTYITGGAPTGAWAGNLYKIAYCVDGGWVFFNPFDGLIAHHADTDSFVVYRGGQWTGLGALMGGPEVLIASAAVCDLGGAGGLCVQITGTTTITGLGSGANALRLVRFAQSLTLAHDSTSLILPGGADIVTQAGDCAVFASDAGGNWRCRQYARADGRMVNMDSPSFTGSLSGPDGGVWASGGIFNVKQLGVNNQIYCQNTSTGSADFASLFVSNGHNSIYLNQMSTNYGGSGLYAANGGQLRQTGGQLSIFTDTNNPILIGINGASVATINANGIGWGVTPAYPLHVHSTAPIMARFEGSAGTNQAIVMSSGAGYMLYLELVDGEAGKFRIGKDSDNAFFIYDIANDRNAFHVSSAGQVDLSSASGQAVAIVAGGSGGVQLASGATSWSAISDGALKDWAAAQSDYRPAIAAIEVGDFTWKADGKADFGAVAQKLDAALAGTPLRDVFVQKPQGKGEPWRVAWDYAGRLALWGAKDLYGLVEKLTARIATLEGALAAD